MQSSDQSPEEPMAAQMAAESKSEPPPQDLRHVQDQPIIEQTMTDVAGIDHEAIRQGRIYPPPPSFYQREETPAQISPLPIQPAQQGSQASAYTYNGQAEYVPLPQAGQAPIPPYPPYGAPPPYPPGYPYPPYPTATKKSYKWIWILAAVLGIIILASCGICAWASSSVFGNAFQQATTVVYGGRDLTNNYYEAIQNKRYSQAYSYLDSQGQLKSLTQAQYLKQAQSLDEQYGPVYRYAAGNPSVSYDTSGTNIDHFTVPVDVTRAKKSYQVLLTVYKVSNQWKITAYTTI